MTSLPTYDFRQPGQLADDVDEALTAWYSSLAMRISDGWEQQLGARLKWAHTELESASSLPWVAKLTDGFYCAQVGYGQAPGTVWVVIPRPFVVGLMGLLLGEDVNELPEDRSLTDVELSVMELAMQEFARGMTDAQPCSRPLMCEFQESPRGQDVARCFPPQRPLVVSTWNVEAPFADTQVSCLVSQDAVLQFMTNVVDCRQDSIENAPSLSDTVTEIPLEVVVRLGTTKVDFSELMNLQPGDVVVLDQRVGEPLSAQVSNSTKFRGWPGRIGNRQAFQIDEIVNED